MRNNFVFQLELKSQEVTRLLVAVQDKIDSLAYSADRGQRESYQNLLGKIRMLQPVDPARPEEK